MVHKSLLFMVLSLLCFSSLSASDSYILYGNEEIFKGTVVLTIDDCLDEENTKTMFELLNENGLKATFFPNLDSIKTHNTSLWKDIVSAGFTIGYHTTDHESGKSYQELTDDFTKFQSGIQSILEDETYKIRFVRPPYGDWNDNWMSWAQDNKLYTVKWNFVPSSKTSFEALEATWRSDMGGSIILIHPRPFDTRWLTLNLEPLTNLVGGVANRSTFPSLNDMYPEP